MAIQVVVLITTLVLASSVKAQQSCNGTTQCKLLPTGRDVVFRFKKLAAEKGVRLIYLDLEIGNDSYNPLESNERFFAKRWVWAKTTNEPMLYLRDDYDIYSLGLFKYQVMHLKVPLDEQPSGCFAQLNTSYQDETVGRTLLSNFTKVNTDNRFFQAIPEDCMCTLRIIKSTELKYSCCRIQNFTETNGPLVHCEILDHPVWTQILISIYVFFGVILYFYCPALPLLLPDLIFNLEHECKAEEKKKKQLQNNQVPPDQQNESGQRQVELSTNSEYSSIEGHSYSGRDRNVQTDYDEELQLIIVNNQVTDQQDEMEQRESTDEEDPDQEGYKSPDEGTLNREIPSDDASPITICALLSDYMKQLPAFKVNFNLKLLLLFFVVLPFPLYLEFALIWGYKMELYREFYHKNSNFPYCKHADIPEVIVCKIAGLSLEQLLTRDNILIFTGCVTSFAILLCVGPTALLYPKEVREYCYVNNCKAFSLGDEIPIHLKVLRRFTYDVVFHALWKYVNTLQKCLVKGVVTCQINSVSRFRLLRPLYTCYLFICSIVGLFVGMVLGVICVFCLLMALGLVFFLLSPTVTRLIFLYKKNSQLMFHIIRACSKCNKYVLLLLMFCLSCIITSQAYLLVTSVLNTSAIFIVKMFLLTVMGLVLNVELVTPYVAFILVVTKNVHLCYCNLQSRYKEVKGMISEQWKKSTERLPWVDNSNDETIPEDLYWFVCGKGQLAYQQNVIPLRTELCRMLRNMAIIVVFLFLSLFAILIFKSVNDMSALVSTILVFVSGVIPALIFEGFTKREKFSGWRKINMKKKIKEAVKEYLGTMKEDDDDDGYEIINVSSYHSQSDDCFEVFLNVLPT